MIAGLSPFESQLVLTPFLILVIVGLFLLLWHDLEAKIREALGENDDPDPPAAVVPLRRRREARQLERRLLEQAREQGAIER